MAEYLVPGDSTELKISVPDEYLEGVPGWVAVILDAWLHRKPADFGGETLPPGVKYVIERHFEAKKVLGKCTTCLDELEVLMEIRRRNE